MEVLKEHSVFERLCLCKYEILSQRWPGICPFYYVYICATYLEGFCFV